MNAMMNRIARSAAALGVAATFAAATPAFAAPVLSSTTAVKSAAPMQTTEVRWRGGGGWHGGWRGGRGFGAGAFVGGLALGFAGAALAAPYYYDYPGYAYDYGGGPAYYGSSYGGYVDPGYAVAPAWGYGPRYYRPGW
jgi:hypothetical protein